MDAQVHGWTKNPKYAYALEMRQNGELCDCRIEVSQKDGDDLHEKVEVINVHKFVLMANSLVFRAMFAHQSMTECRESHIKIADSTVTAVRQMVHYLYVGKLPPDYDVERDGIPLAHIANKYQIKSLMESNEGHLIDSLSLNNVFDLLELANLLQLDGLYYECGQKILHNLGRLTETDKWAEFKDAFKLGILKAMADYQTKNDERFRQNGFAGWTTPAHALG